MGTGQGSGVCGWTASIANAALKGLGIDRKDFGCFGPLALSHEAPDVVVLIAEALDYVAAASSVVPFFAAMRAAETPACRGWAAPADVSHLIRGGRLLTAAS